MHHHTGPEPLGTEPFPTDPSGLPEAGRPVDLHAAHDPHQRPSWSVSHRAFNGLQWPEVSKARRSGVEHRRC